MRVSASSYLKPFFGSVFLSLWELRRFHNVIIKALVQGVISLSRRESEHTKAVDS